MKALKRLPKDRPPCEQKAIEVAKHMLSATIDAETRNVERIEEQIEQRRKAHERKQREDGDHLKVLCRKIEALRKAVEIQKQLVAEQA